MTINSKDINPKIYFIGIGGIGMSALAKYAIFNKFTVYGYDRTKSDITSELETLGAIIYYQEHIQAIEPAIDIVVYTPAIPESNSILKYYKTHNYFIAKRSEFLQILCQDKKVVAVAGTHGKTTTSTLIAHLLKMSGVGCTAFLGGISNNYQTNFWISNNQYVVVEADEYDRSFLKLTPYIAVVTTMDPDHLDIYGDAKNFNLAFEDFMKQTQPNGFVVLQNKLEAPINLEAQLVKYDAFNKNDDLILKIINPEISQGNWVFHFHLPNEEPVEAKIFLPGQHNLQNICAAIQVSALLGLTSKQIKKGLENFKGIKRRFEYKVKTHNIVLIDDYAHHPVELKALIQSVQQCHPNKNFTLIFQPHLYSRTKEFYKEFAEVLSIPNKTILLPIYPAREKAIPGINSELILNSIDNPNKELMTKKEVTEYIKFNHEQIFVMAGAGDIDQLINHISEILQKL
ncbi:MAG: UDP-N-acetylmuramate--L-alanine ligase [Alphaproteobacteria bacterium]|nr:UDP-N-acetylmuramate--L-alanine ligase [Alphaproteobacteria bacterium]